MLACARIATPDGRLHELVHGDLIGRLHSAALALDDGRVSEAHAMISLREGELRLISLRGAFAIEGRPETEVALEAGLDIQLTRGLVLRVVEVVLPDEILGIEGPGLPRQALPGVCSLILDPQPHLRRGWHEGAPWHAWCNGEGWSYRLESSQSPLTLSAGMAWTLDGVEIRAVGIPLDAAGQAPTRQFGGVDAPLTLVANFDSVHILQDGRPVLTLSGVQARLVSELVALGGPVAWTLLVEQLWPRQGDAAALRARFDVNLSRLRRKLRAARIRTDLVNLDGAGVVELLLYPHDRVEDRT